MAKKIEKSIVPLFIDEDGDPAGMLFFNPKTRSREIFVCRRATEDQIIRLYEQNDAKIKSFVGGPSSTDIGSAPGHDEKLGTEESVAAGFAVVRRKNVLSRSLAVLRP